MLRCELLYKKRKGLERDHLLVWIWKVVKIMFNFIAPGKEIHIVDKGDYLSVL